MKKLALSILTILFFSINAFSQTSQGTILYTHCSANCAFTSCSVSCQQVAGGGGGGGSICTCAWGFASCACGAGAGAGTSKVTCSDIQRDIIQGGIDLVTTFKSDESKILLEKFKEFQRYAISNDSDVLATLTVEMPKYFDALPVDEQDQFKSYVEKNTKN